MTVPYAEVIGDPVAHSKSPAIHQFWLDALGQAGAYQAKRTTPEEIDAYLASRRSDADWRGCNVTMPLKQAILPHLAGLDMRAERAGAVNLVGADLVGRNSDVIAICEMMTSDCLPPEAKVRIVGTGGAARAAVTGALEAGIPASGITIYGRDADKARAVARDMLGSESQAGTISSVPLRDTALLINAAPLGMTGFPPFPLRLDDASPDLIVYDLVYDPLETPLLRSARARGHRCRDGLDMLIGQAAAAFTLFFGAEPPRALDRQLRERLVR